jgi:hypothetical protein
VHGESGQAAVDWVALVLLAALVLTAGAALGKRAADRDLGDLVAKRIASPPATARAAPTSAASAPSAAAPAAPARRAPAPRARPAAGASRAIHGIGSLARHAWVLCLGYQRWRYEREHPIATIEGLPLREALRVVNDCLNPHDYLLED